MSAKKTLRSYHELHRISEQYLEIYGQLPRIQLISHSHGGNIALNLPAIGKQYEKSLMIRQTYYDGMSGTGKNYGMH